MKILTTKITPLFMKIEDQVISPDQAKKLQELGVVQRSYFMWMIPTQGSPYLTTAPFGETVYTGFAAFTVAELGVMLPDDCHTEKDANGIFYGFRAYDTTGCCCSPMLSEYSHFSTEAETRAFMLIYLLEKYPGELEKVNERLSK